jgi:hypothetical protein
VSVCCHLINPKVICINQWLIQKRGEERGDMREVKERRYERSDRERREEIGNGRHQPLYKWFIILCRVTMHGS